MNELQWERILKMRQDGQGYAAIVKVVGLSKQRWERICRRERVACRFILMLGRLEWKRKGAGCAAQCLVQRWRQGIERRGGLGTGERLYADRTE